MATITKHVCDIKDCCVEANILGVTRQVIFKTEQTEGRYCNPYIQHVKMDLCHFHENKVLKGIAIIGRGAQGYNEYTFNEVS